MTPTEFVALVNQTLEYAYSGAEIVGEVASFKVNQGKWVFFDIKDEETSVPCFMSVWNLRQPLEDGMRVKLRGVPKMTKWGKFSFTVNSVVPVGEGSIKKAYEMLKKKLAGEGLFDPAKKRKLPDDITRLGVISSTGAAGYADFIKIINARWGGMKVTVAHTQVQGMEAPDQIIRALKYFNEHGEVEVIAILRGGGSADDLSCFNDETLVREIAASKIPVITGIGHEVDESLADLAADVRASTPSNAAEMLTRDRAEELDKVGRLTRMMQKSVMDKIETARLNNRDKCERARRSLVAKYIEPMEREVRTKMRNIADGMMYKFIEPSRVENRRKVGGMLEKIRSEYEGLERRLVEKERLLEVLNPDKVLRQGYAIIAGEVDVGKVIRITTFMNEIEAKVNKISERK